MKKLTLLVLGLVMFCAFNQNICAQKVYAERITKKEIQENMFRFRNMDKIAIFTPYLVILESSEFGEDERIVVWQNNGILCKKAFYNSFRSNENSRKKEREEWIEFLDSFKNKNTVLKGFVKKNSDTDIQLLNFNFLYAYWDHLPILKNGKIFEIPEEYKEVMIQLLQLGIKTEKEAKNLEELLK